MSIIVGDGNSIERTWTLQQYGEGNERTIAIDYLADGSCKVSGKQASGDYTIKVPASGLADDLLEAATGLALTLLVVMRAADSQVKRADQGD